MFKLRIQIERQIQEIVFFLSLLLAFTTALSGILYLACSPENLTYIIGVFGAVVDHGLFSFLGYAFFYLPVIALHMGYVMNFHIFSFRDFKREYPVLAYSLLAHIIILVLFANMLSVIQLSLEIPSSKLLTSGAGGLVGHLLSGALYASVGIYGSVISLFALMSVTALLGGFFELPDVIVAIKSGSNITRYYTAKSLKTANSSFISTIQFLLRSNEEATAHAGGAPATNNWISNSWSKANHLMTDHFHIYKKEEIRHEKKEDSKKDVKGSIQKIEIKPLSIEKSIQPKGAVVYAKAIQKVKPLSKKTIVKTTAVALEVKPALKTVTKVATRTVGKIETKTLTKIANKHKAKKK